ncbi:DUF421 domain-containing protein [Paenibacillus chungangensis]|uniref:DUF421 domain-containing protein n=1 Tax=Paenibacillus chungangensis TaxID=696535 RepID=A0ABW3HR43_9BACL
MHFVKDSLLVIIRIYTIFPLMLIVALFMGRRSIGQLPIFDFIIILSLGSVIGADIADPRIEHIHTAVAIIFIGLLQKLISYFMLKYRKFGKLITFEPVIVIYQGKFMHHNLKKIQYTVDDILQLVREYEIFDPATVELAILEGNGGISILKKAGSQPATKQDLGLSGKQVGIAYPVVKEGLLQMITLKELGYSQEWLLKQLELREKKLSEIFFASLDENGQLTVTEYGNVPDTPPVYH